MSANQKYHDLYWSTWFGCKHTDVPDWDDYALEAVIETVRADVQGEHHTHITINCSCQCRHEKLADEVAKHLIMPENANEKYYNVFMAHAWARCLTHREKRAIDAVVQVAMRDAAPDPGKWMARPLVNNVSAWMGWMDGGNALGITQGDLDQAREAAVNDHYGPNFMTALERYAMEADDAKTTEP